ncbi:MAG: transcriptional regulator [Desulfurococcaceae archaeon]
MNENYETIRERIMRILESTKTPLTASEIANMLGNNTSPEDVYEHLAHVAKTIRAKSHGRKVLVMEPPVCKKCGFVFKDIKKPKKPSRCPKCKSEWIASPRFMIAENI